MGLLDKTQQEYYQGNDFGSYQFTSLEDIINYFMVVYVGEGKTISKVSKTDVAFHAQRAMQELSFDTFKSIKSQEIELPPSLTMKLPHDYVNYTKLSWSDTSGIKHPLYPTKDTSNPFKIKQDTNGDPIFTTGSEEVLINGSLEELLSVGWQNTTPHPQAFRRGVDVIEITGGRLALTSFPNFWGTPAQSFGRAQSPYQELDTTNITHLSISAVAERAAAAYQGSGTSGAISDDPIITFGVSTIPPSNKTNPIHTINPSPNNETIYDLYTVDGELSYIKWDGDDTAATPTSKSLDLIDVTNYNKVYIIITSNVGWNGITTGFTDFTKNNGTVIPFGTYGSVDGTVSGNSVTNYIDNMSVEAIVVDPDLVRDGDSTTWTNYKSQTPNENVNPEVYSYDTDIYDFNIGERYGIDPQHAQVNGSFYIDNLKGLIHFSSNISGKTVILDYISDSLGTDGEMQVHKFAEDAMYKWIMYAILSTRANTPEYIVRRYQKEKFAATRQAKLRLSNIKLEELTQILRGKSKRIKH